MRTNALLLWVGVLAACIPCLLVPVAAAVVASSAVGGVLGLLGTSWVLAIVLAVPVSAAILVLRRRHAARCSLPGRQITVR
jgi:hypothetical protein